MTFGRLGSSWDSYLESFRLHAHQLIVWAHQDVRDRIDSSLEEPDITGLLGDAMWNRLNYHPDTPPEYVHYTIGDQVPISPAGQMGNERLRLDLSIVRSGVRPRISYIFEAKRLQTSVFSIGKYVGTGGMGDFVECRYAQENPEAAMVGLFHNKDVSYWHGELCRVFLEDVASNAPRLGIRSHPRAINVLPALTGELESNHVRKDHSSIRILHIFLDCS